VKKALLLVCLLLAAACWADENFSANLGGGVKSYLPGDLVHLVVGAPADVVEIKAVLPDGQTIKLDFERRTHVWHGYWEVPYGFKKGTYSAALTAFDVEGKSFSGQTVYFYIGEPALVTLIGLGSGAGGGSGEAAIRQLASEAKISPAEAAAEAARIRALARASRKPAVSKPVKQSAKQLAKRPAKPSAKKPAKQLAKRPAGTAAPDKTDLDLQKVKLLTSARANMLQKEYDRADKQLRALVRLEPDNANFQRMLTRLHAVIKNREEGQ
jgi:hypothetical protein